MAKDKYPHLFSPITLRGVTIRNRIMQPAQGTGFATLAGHINRRLIDYHAAKAAGGVGLIVFEHAGIEREGSVIPLGEPLIAGPEFISGLRRLCETVHGHGAKILVQLGHAGRRSIYSPLHHLLAQIPGVEQLYPILHRRWPQLSASLFRSARALSNRPGGPSVEPRSWHFFREQRFEFIPLEHPRSIPRSEIHRLVDLHAQAARRAVEASADGVEIKIAHGYLLSQFLSPLLNRRIDEYGGGIEGRLRFTLEVIEAVRRAIGDDKLLSIRMAGAEFLEGGLAIEEAKEMARRIDEEGNVDLFSVTAGMYGSYPAIVPPSFDPHAVFVPLAEAIKSVVSRPVAGGIRVVEPPTAEAILEAGRVDLVVMGRALLADPEWPAKAKAGRDDAIRCCIGCNQCVDLVEGLSPGIHCVVNPSLGEEGLLRRPTAKRSHRIVVVGGGLAGLFAATSLAERGHRVVLYERDRLGGRFRYPAMVSGLEEYGRLLTQLKGRIERLPIDLRLDEATPESIASLEPERVILASGAIHPPALPDVGLPLASIDRAFRAPEELADPILVWGDDLYALTTALFLAQKGRRVAVVEVPCFFPLDLMRIGSMGLYLRVRLAERKVPFITGRPIDRLRRGVWDAVSRIPQLRRIDFATGVDCRLIEDRRWLEPLRRLGLRANVIGDARRPRKSASAAGEAFELAYREKWSR